MVKQDQQSRPMCRQIPIGVARTSFSGQHRMRLATCKTSPQVSPRWPRRQLGSDQHSKEHSPGGSKIKMTLESAEPKGKRLRWQMVKGNVGPCWKSLIQSELSRGSHKSPNRVRNAKSRNITPDMTETRVAGVEQNTRHKAEPSTLYQKYIDALIK